MINVRQNKFTAYLLSVTFGDYLSALLKKIKKGRRGSRAAKMLCEHLQRWGIDARMIEEGGDCVTLRRQEIDIVKVNHTRVYGAASYSFYYGVRRDVKGSEAQVKARMKIQAKGLTRREVVDFKWIGGELADELNRDDTLKAQLLRQLKINPRGSVDIFPDKKAGVVWIATTKYMSPFPKSATPFSIPDEIMPSKTSFRLYNTIATHIRNEDSFR